MKPKSFAEIIQAFLAALIIGVFLYKAATASDYKDALNQLAMLAVGFWIGSSSGSKSKDGSST